MLRRRVFTVPKEPDAPNEDTVRVSDRKNRYALSDGASVSYDSASWSRIVATNYVRNPNVTRTWLDNCIGEFKILHDREAMPWHKQAAYDRGSFTSILGICIEPNAQVRIDAVGDTIAVLCDDGRIVHTFPYSTAEQFEHPPTLLSSDPEKNVMFNGDALCDDRTCVWRVQHLHAPILYCMTDALGHWFLSEQPETAIQRIQSLYSLHRFERFVHDERVAHRLKRDDTTLLVLW